MDGAGRFIDVDFKRLEEQVGGDSMIVREVLALFSEHARTVLRALDPEGRPEAWRKAAHSLKGSALGIGADALAEACGEAEAAHHAPAPDKRAIRARVADRLGAALTDIALYTAR
jgi:HPt (histidine-containing phosphotransfer) domain-containing protein